MPKTTDVNQVAAVYDLLATPPWNTSLVELDVLRIRQWYEHVRREISQDWEGRLEESRILDRDSAQYRDDAAALTERAKERTPDGKGSLSYEEKVSLYQRRTVLDENQKVLRYRCLLAERASAALLGGFKNEIAGLQRLVHDKTAEIAEKLKQQGMLKQEIDEKIAVSRDAVREMTSALVKEFLPEEAQQPKR